MNGSWNHSRSKIREAKSKLGNASRSKMELFTKQNGIIREAKYPKQNGSIHEAFSSKHSGSKNNASRIIQEAKEKQRSLEGVKVKSIREAKWNHSRKVFILKRSRSIFYHPPELYSEHIGSR